MLVHVTGCTNYFLPCSMRLIYFSWFMGIIVWFPLFKGQKKATVSWRTPNRVNIK